MSDDCISRQAVLKNIKNLYPDMPVMDIMGSRRKWLEKYAPYFECENVIEHLPSVTPKPKTGHWIFQKIKQGKRMWCSNCNACFDLCCNQIKRYNKATREDDTWIYCPWCGAKIIEPQESEDKE